MKKNLILLLLCLGFVLNAETILRDWKSYTNTTHISSAISVENEIILATWGGLLYYDLMTARFEGPILKSDGLAGSEVSSVAKLSDGTLLVGTKGGGISRIKDNEFIMPLNADSGFDLDYVYQIEAFGDNFAVVTDFGISVFSKLPGWPLPATISYYANNGLSSNNITAITVSCDSILICGSDNGIDYAILDDVNNLEWQHLDSDNSPLSNDNITDIYCQGNTIAIATQSGINVTESFTDLSNWSVYHAGISCFPVYVSEIGDIWSSEGYWAEDELSILENSDICLIKIDNNGNEVTWSNDDLGLSKGMVTAICPLDDNIVVTFWGEGMIINDGNSWSESIAQNCINANFNFELCVDSSNRLWIAHGVQGAPKTQRSNRGISLWNGDTWEVFTSNNSGLVSDNVNSIVEVDEDLLWFTSFADDADKQGVNSLNVSDAANLVWDFKNYRHPSLPSIGLPSSSVGDTFKANDGNIWLSCYQRSIVALDQNMTEQYRFSAPGVEYQGVSNAVDLYQGSNYSVISGWLSGFEIWEGAEIPAYDGDNWNQPALEDFQNGFVNDAIERDELFENQVWIASSQGLIMYDGEGWFRYGKDSTKRQYLSSSNTWQPTKLLAGQNDSPDWWYFEGQEHLYGGANTFPTALFVDPFNVLWIGTETNGICRYDIDNNIFMTWNTDNSPLFSNKINDMAYEEVTGTLYIATPEGLNSVRIGIKESNNSETEFNNVVAFPNPFYPANGDVVRIENIGSESMPKDSESCSIYDLEGLLVRELDLNYFQQYEWDGTNSSGKTCSSGIYFYMVTSPAGKSATGKIIMIR